MRYRVLVEQPWCIWCRMVCNILWLVTEIFGWVVVFGIVFAVQISAHGGNYRKNLVIFTGRIRVINFVAHVLIQETF